MMAVFSLSSFSSSSACESAPSCGPATRRFRGGRHVDSSQSHVNSSLSHSQRLSGVSIDPSLRLTSVSLPSLTAFSSVSARQAPESAEIAQDNPCNLMRWSGQCGRRPRVPEIALVMWSDVQWSPRGSGRSPSTQPRAISGILGRLPLPRPHHDVARVLSGNLGTLGHSRALSGALGHSLSGACRA